MSKVYTMTRRQADALRKEVGALRAEIKVLEDNKKTAASGSDKARLTREVTKLTKELTGITDQLQTAPPPVRTHEATCAEIIGGLEAMEGEYIEKHAKWIRDCMMNPEYAMKYGIDLIETRAKAGQASNLLGILRNMKTDLNVYLSILHDYKKQVESDTNRWDGIRNSGVYGLIEEAEWKGVKDFAGSRYGSGLSDIIHRAEWWVEMVRMTEFGEDEIPTPEPSEESTIEKQTKARYENVLDNLQKNLREQEYTHKEKVQELERKIRQQAYTIESYQALDRA